MKKWIFWLGIAISIVLMYFSLRKLNIFEAWDIIKIGELLVDPARSGCLFHGGLGPGLALALFVSTLEENQHEEHVSRRRDWLHGE